ncbi:cytochrome P450 [Flammula alnicola]|nr:cytochrome P450 [Flammula alnicola]
MFSSLIVIEIALTVVSLLLIYRLFFRKSDSTYGRLPLPPGPRALPIIGNVLDMPTHHEWETYHKWCQELDTDILYLNVAGTSIVILDTRDVALELFEKRSSLYSGRQKMPMINDLMGWDFDLAFMDYGERWRQHRKLMHQAFNPSAADEYKPLQLRVARDLLAKLLNTKDLMGDIRHWAGDTIISLAYGINVQPRNDPYIMTAQEGVHPILEAAMPGAFFVDLFPILKYVPEWMPGAGFKRKARRWRHLQEQMLNKPYDALIRTMENGTAKTSFAFNSLQQMAAGKGGVYTEENIKQVAGTLYQAGSDTSVAALAHCILLLMENPNVVKKAQQEIDSVTDGSRLPDFNDEASLPYITAVMKESLRFWTLGPLGVPHLLHAEDEYKGYRLPAGSIIVPNIWAIHHNEELYPNPFIFNPDRFLGDNPEIDDHFDSAYSTKSYFSPRICPGRFMAASSVWIMLASMLAVYDVSKPIDKDGNIVEPSHDFPPSLLLTPRPFQCAFTIRSKTAEQLLAMSK